MKKFPTTARAIIIGCLAVLSASCGPDGASDGGASSARAGGPHSEGKRLYLTRCTACHAAEPVGKYSAAQWHKIIPDMSKRSKLNAAQQQALLDYVLKGG